MKLNVLPILGLCDCRSVLERDNCAACEGTGYRIDFAALHALPVADPVPVVYRVAVKDGSPGPAGLAKFFKLDPVPVPRGLRGLPALDEEEGDLYD